MKNLKTVIFNIATLGLLVFQNGYSQNSHKDMGMKNTKAHSCEATCAHDVKTQSVVFKKGKVYELAYADVKPEKMNQLNNQYFPKAMPFMVKYGAKMIGGFGVVKNESEMFFKIVRFGGTTLLTRFIENINLSGSAMRSPKGVNG